MENIQYKSLEFKSDVEKREFTAIITDNSIDRDSEVLLPEGMNKKEYMKNPIILFNHNSNEPIGTALGLRRSGNGWKATGKLAEGIERIDNVWKLVKQGVLKTISVGFRVDEQRAPTKKDIQEFGKDVRNIISKWSLLEFSVVSVPANHNAIITAAKSLDINPTDILPNYKEEETIEKQVEATIEELEIKIDDTTKEKIIKTVKEQEDISLPEIMKYFKEEIVNEIKRNKGILY